MAGNPECVAEGERGEVKTVGRKGSEFLRGGTKLNNEFHMMRFSVVWEEEARRR